LAFNAPQGPKRDVSFGMGNRDSTLSRSVAELDVRTDTTNFLPSVTLEGLYDRATIHVCIYTHSASRGQGLFDLLGRRPRLVLLKTKEAAEWWPWVVKRCHVGETGSSAKSRKINFTLRAPIQLGLQWLQPMSMDIQFSLAGDHSHIEYVNEVDFLAWLSSLG